MNKERITKMDPYLLLSWINTMLRNEFSSIDSLCKYYELSKEEIFKKLDTIGYNYIREVNQFR